MVERLLSLSELRCVRGVGRTDSPKVTVGIMRVSRRIGMILEDRGKQRLQRLRYG